MIHTRKKRLLRNLSVGPSPIYGGSQTRPEDPPCDEKKKNRYDTHARRCGSTGLQRIPEPSTCSNEDVSYADDIGLVL